MMREASWEGPPAEKWIPHTYMKRAVKFLLERACGGLFMRPGLGKTSIVLATLKVLRKEKLTRRTLVIAPLRVCYSVWPEEVKKWSDFSDMKVAVLHGKNRQAALESKADIFVINPEGLPWLLSGGRFATLDAQTLVVDEVSKFKHTNRKRFKLLKTVLNTFSRRYILTGTPAARSLLDLFGQVYLLDMGNALGRYITHFRATYFYPTGYGGYTWVPQEGSEERIYEKLRPLVTRVSGDETAKLPKLINNTVYVDLPPAALRTYTELHKELVAEIRGTKVFSPTKSVALMKCRQIANGGVYTRGMIPGEQIAAGVWRKIHDAKTDAVLDIVEELQGDPVLIAYEFGHDLERLLKALGKDTPYLGAGSSGAAGAKIITRWNNGEIPVLLGHPASMGHGLNLQGAGSTIIWHSLTDNLEYYEQFIHRLLRQGNKADQVIVHHIVARKTSDLAIMRMLAKKAATQNDLMDALLEMLED